MTDKWAQADIKNDLAQFVHFALSNFHVCSLLKNQTHKHAHTKKHIYVPKKLLTDAFLNIWCHFHTHTIHMGYPHPQNKTH